MIHEVMHIGVTVSDLDRSISFYRDILGLQFQGELMMEGEEADVLFARKNCKVRVAYFNGSDDLKAPPIELMQFIRPVAVQTEPMLTETSISEICFHVCDMDAVYKHLLENKVECLSAPQSFDFSAWGFGKSRALYFKDPDGIILELMEKTE